MHDLLQDIWLLLSVRIFIPSSEHPKQAKIVLSVRLFTTSIHVLTSVCFVVRGESPGCRLFGTASMLDWLRKSSPTTHRGALRKDGAEIRVFYVLVFFNVPLYLNNAVETAAPFNVGSHPRC